LQRSQDRDTTKTIDGNEILSGSINEVSSSDDLRNKQLFEEAGVNPSLIAGKILSLAKTTSEKIQNKVAHISTIVSETPIINAIEKERLKFCDELVETKDPISDKWKAIIADKDVQGHILSISQDPKHFLEDPPITRTDQTEFIKIEVIASELLKLDPNLAKMRFELVPKLISEEKFWNNYAYRLSLIEKLIHKSSSSNDAGCCGGDGSGDTRLKDSTTTKLIKTDKENVEETTIDEELEKELLSDLDYEMVGRKEENDKSEEPWEDEIEDLLKENSDQK